MLGPQCHDQYLHHHAPLPDNTIEVLQIYGTNCGRDPYPLLIKRAKIPKSLDDEAAGFYHWSDLDIGTLIDVVRFSESLLKVLVTDKGDYRFIT